MGGVSRQWPAVLVGRLIKQSPIPLHWEPGPESLDVSFCFPGATSVLMFKPPFCKNTRNWIWYLLPFKLEMDFLIHQSFTQAGGLLAFSQHIRLMFFTSHFSHSPEKNNLSLSFELTQSVFNLHLTEKKVSQLEFAHFDSASYVSNYDFSLS